MNDQNQTGRSYWQSLNELANTPAVRAAIENEFASYDPNEMLKGSGTNQSRRKFLQLAGASMALAGITLTGCRRWPKENVVEQTSRPQGRIPGVPEQYASAFELGGYAQPLLVSSYDGRPIKIEGNPLHPQVATFGGKMGASSVLAQASLLEMYDPERSRAIVHRNVVDQGQAASAIDFTAAISQQTKKSGKIAILTEATSSPTTRDALSRFVAANKGAKVYEYEAISRDNHYVADKQAFGQPVRQVYDLSKADFIVSFDADLLGTHPYAIRHSNDWAQKRKSADTTKTMNRMYVLESMYSTTGTVADERFPTTIRFIEQMVLQLAHKAGLESAQDRLNSDQTAFVEKIWNDLAKAEGKAIVAGGHHLRADVLGIINAINEKLRSFGNTITFRSEPDRATHIEQMRALVDSINTGNVDTLIILGGNPVYDAPTDLNFGGALGNLRGRGVSVHLSVYDNETSAACQWHVNRAHYLESWGDSEAWDGTICIQQPLIRPLFDGFTPASLLSAISGETVASVLKVTEDAARELTLDQAVLYRTWAGKLNDPFVANNPNFRKALHDGFVGAGAPVTVKAVRKPTVSFPAAGGEFEVRFVADYTMYDGRFANNGWLQELPDPVTKIAWDNAALISYNDAQKLGVTQDDNTTDLIELVVGGKKITIAAYIMPGQPSGVITLPLGYGRKRAGAIVLTENPGSIGYNIGFDTYSIRATGAQWVAYCPMPVKTGDRYSIATTQTHHIIEPVGMAIREERVGEESKGGKIVHESTLQAFVKNPHAPHKKAHVLKELQLFPSPSSSHSKNGGPAAFSDPHAWGMAMDMNACIGCNACVVACQSENNIPIVGKDQVIRNREMHWLRIDRYFKSGAPDYAGKIADENPQVTYQPITCVHCENAPCEQVCPVAATVHDSEGLNTMIYNRCIGTRYCANNCPYKIRKFNYLDYHSKHPREGHYPWLGIPDTQQKYEVDKVHALVFNPDVTVRMRGVMEKCTYCVQRIKHATIDRRNEWINGKRDKPTVDDFDVITACQQACPTEAIVFGDLNDPDSLVRRQHEGPRAYQVLQELNNRPRTHHLAKLRNPVDEPKAAVKEEVH